MSPVNVVIPMKDPSVSKQRLSPVMNSAARAELALGLFRRTLAFFRTHFPSVSLLVVTSSDLIEELSLAEGAAVLKSEADQGLSHAVSQAASWSRRHGFRTQLYLPADIARLEIGEIAELLAMAGTEPGVVICPAEDEGTNALLTTPPDAIPFRFGRRSSRVHQAEAQLMRLPCSVHCLPHLTFDVDTPADWFRLKNNGYSRTREVIG